MKVLLKIKTGIVLILSIFLAVAIVSSCTPEPGRRDAPAGDKKTDTDRKATSTLKCKLPSGNGSCKKDKDCVDWCEDDLNLSGDARDKCFDLDDKTVERLVELFDDVFEKPDDEKLDDLKQEDLELICSAVKELDHDVLADRLDYSSSSRAKYVLEWVAETKEAIEVFENAEKDEGLKMFKKLLSRAGGQSGTGDDDVLAGLVENVASDSDEDKNVIRIALDANNDKLVNYIHDDIITDEDELCSSSNQPSELGNCGGTSAYSSDSEEDACILGVYCKMAPDDNDGDNEFRKDIADYLKHRNIVNFIKEDVEDGGLGLTADDADDWTHAVCVKLDTCWTFKTGFTY